MMFGMEVSDFLAFAIWPILWTTAAIIMYFVMRAQDLRDEEADKEMMGGDPK